MEEQIFPHPLFPSPWKEFCQSFKNKSLCYHGCLQNVMPCHIYILCYLLFCKHSRDTKHFQITGKENKFLEICHPILLAAQSRICNRTYIKIPGACLLQVLGLPGLSSTTQTNTQSSWTGRDSKGMRGLGWWMAQMIWQPFRKYHSCH